MASEPVKPYFTRLLRVLTFYLDASKIVILKENGVVNGVVKGKIDRCFLNVELWDKVVNGIII